MKISIRTVLILIVAILGAGHFFSKSASTPPSVPAEVGWWVFDIPKQRPAQPPILDLRYLNEKEAGESGFVQRNGAGFKLGNGEPVKFWGGNCIREAMRSHEQMDALAAQFARVGINLVRLHGPIFYKCWIRARDPDFDKHTDMTELDGPYVDNLYYMVNALKKQGIYSYLSYYAPLWIQMRPSYGFEGYEQLGCQDPFSLLFFEPKMQEIYKSWTQKFLTTKNPYTGISLAKDPAVAVVEIVNEDGYLFHTFDENDMPVVYKAELEKMFGQWLTTRYGTVEKAFAAWSGAKHERDHLTPGQVGIFGISKMISGQLAQASPGMKKRLSDELRFLVENIRGFYTDMQRYFHNTLGVQSLVSAGNWRTADPTLLEALERYSDMTSDLLDRHGYYFNGEHKGDPKRIGWKLCVGDSFVNRSAVIEPTGLPMQTIEYENYPSFISELGWPMPNRYLADNAFIPSAYGSLEGIDGFGFHGCNTPSWEPGAMKFPFYTPAIFCQFPAEALQFRRGDVKEAPTVIHQVLNLDDLYAFKGTGYSEEEHFDELRKADIPKELLASTMAKAVTDSSVDPFSFYVGKVVRSFGDDKSKSVKTDFSSYIDRKNKIVKSITGELLWNYNRGFVTVDTKNSQGITGFLSKAGPIELGDLTIDSKNEYGCIHVISLDNSPLATSKKILVQAFTEEKTSGWEVDENNKILNLGKSPKLIKNIEAAIVFKNGIKKAIALDGEGYFKENLSVDNPSKLTLPLDSMYIIVER